MKLPERDLPAFLAEPLTPVAMVDLRARRQQLFTASEDTAP